LLNNQSDSTKSLWNDYPRDTTYARLSLSLSLSGLALHTLNLIHRSTPAINRRWIRNLEKSQAAKTNITYRERSDLFYKLGNYGEADFRDVTRHLVIPWQIIATVDIYKDLSFMERTKANIWLDTVLEGLNSDDIRHQERFIRAEIYIGLRYLQDENYIFK
jgi:hypothetical protein